MREEVKTLEGQGGGGGGEWKGKGGESGGCEQSRGEHRGGASFLGIQQLVSQMSDWR
jgi:hypothetical protein